MGKEKKSLVTKIDYSTPEQREKFDRLAKQYEEERERQRLKEEADRKAAEEERHRILAEDAKILYQRKPESKSPAQIKRELYEHSLKRLAEAEEDPEETIEKYDIESLKEAVNELSIKIEKMNSLTKLLVKQLTKIEHVTSTKLLPKDIALLEGIRNDLLDIVHDASVYRSHRSREKERYRNRER